MEEIQKFASPRMFNRISRHYDLLNHLLSAGQDIRWRRKAVLQLNGHSAQVVLDVATGTGDLLLLAAKHNSNISYGIGIDPAAGMLEIAQSKIRRDGPSNRLVLLHGDGLNLPLSSQSVAGAMIAFGIRNIEPFELCLRELQRVLKPAGRLVVLEFSIPTSSLARKVYLFYFRCILPTIGGWLSGDPQAYRYLNQTVETFPFGKAFCQKMAAAGFANIQMMPLTFGIATIYWGDKS